jgi:hypothetical protein
LYVCTLFSSSYINSGMYNLVCRKWWWDFRFSWCGVWRRVFCDIASCTLIEADQISEVCIASIIRAINIHRPDDV